MKAIVIAAALTLALCSGCLYPPHSICESGPGAPLSYASGAPVPQACQDWESLPPEQRAQARIAYQTQTAVANQPEPSFWRWMLTPEPAYPVYQMAPPVRGYNSTTAPNFTPWIPGPLPSVSPAPITVTPSYISPQPFYFRPPVASPLYVPPYVPPLPPAAPYSSF